MLALGAGAFELEAWSCLQEAPKEMTQHDDNSCCTCTVHEVAEGPTVAQDVSGAGRVHRDLGPTGRQWWGPHLVKQFGPA